MAENYDFKSLIYRKGFKSVSAFGRAIGAKTVSVPKTVDKLFLYASALHIPVEELLRICYPDEMAENAAAAKTQIPSNVIIMANAGKKDDDEKEDGGDAEELEYPEYIPADMAETRTETRSNTTSVTSEDSDITSRLERMENALNALMLKVADKSASFENTLHSEIIAEPETPDICENI